MVGDYIPIYRDEKFVWIDVNWIRTNETDFKNNYEWLEVFNKQHGLFMKMVKISYYFVNIYDALFFFLLASLLFRNKWETKGKLKK